MATREELLKLAEEYIKSKKDVVYFIETILGAKLWAKQKEIAYSVFKNQATAVRSCHASGKTFLAACLVLAWLRLHPVGDALVVTTSSSWKQVEGELWLEIRKAIAKSKWQWPKSNLTELNMPGGSRAFGLSTDDPTNFHGFHAKYVLVIVDEAAGVKAEIYSALKGIMAGGEVHVLYLMNPTEASGPSVDLFDDPDVTPFVIDGMESPNMDGLHLYDDINLNTEETDPEWQTNLLALSDEELSNDPQPYLIRRKYIKKAYFDTIRVFGGLKEEAIDWWSRVRGAFPKEMLSQLIKKEWVEAAFTNQIDRTEARKDYDDVIGIDVAGPGKNETALCWRNGITIIKQQSWSRSDPYDEIKAVIGPPRPNLWIHIDAVAIGWHMATAFVRDGYLLKAVNVKETSTNTVRFANKKSEYYWHLRELYQGDENSNWQPYVNCIKGVGIDKLSRDQLLSIRWDQKGPHGTIRIESKEDMERRGVQSPDRAEAMMLAFAGSAIAITTRPMVYDSSNTISGSADQTLRGPGWESKLIVGSSSIEQPQPNKPIPQPVQNWLEAQQQQKLVNKHPNQRAVRAVLTQMSDPQEYTRILSLLEAADDVSKTPPPSTRTREVFYPGNVRKIEPR